MAFRFRSSKRSRAPHRSKTRRFFRFAKRRTHAVNLSVGLSKKSTGRYSSRALALLLLSVCLVVLLLALLPGQQNLAVQIITTELSFKTKLPKAEPRYRFLNSIRGIDTLTITGKRSEPLPLTGKFSGNGIGEQTVLEIELPYDHSRLQLSTLPPQTSATEPNKIEISVLYLQNKTDVKTLSYVPFNRRLFMDYAHEEQPSFEAGSLLDLYIGDQPLQLTIEGYRLPQLGKEDPDGNLPLTLTFDPDGMTELALTLPQQGTFSTVLPPLDSTDDTTRWFWGQIPVEQVAFVNEERRNADIFERSTIGSGQIGLGSKELKIEEGQFLILKNAGIQILREIKILDEKGIEVRATGKSSAAQVGLYPDFPIRGVRTNATSLLFPSDVAIAVVSFSGAMVASLLSWLVDHPPESSK